MIAELLEHGAENTKSTKDLMRISGLSPRQIVEQVSRERASGKPILSKNNYGGGYYLPDTDNNKGLLEIRACINTISNRGRHTLMALRTLRRESERREILASGQTEIEGVKE